jgi:hypothetical protein
LAPEIIARVKAARERGVSRQRIHQIRHPGRHTARQAVAQAIESGALARPDACSRCDKPGPLEAHHEDYGQPLKVKWLCRQCHRNEQPRKSASGMARDQRIDIRLDSVEAAAVRRLAAQEERSASDMARKLLREALAQRALSGPAPSSRRRSIEPM